MKILFVSHCILNACTIVKDGDNDIALKKRFLKYALENDIQLIQLPCPEFMMCGHLRWGQTKEQYTTPTFVKKCAQIAENIADQISEYQRFPDRFEILGIVGIDGSPTCGVNQTCVGFEGGEFRPHKPMPQARMVSQSGVLFDELKKVVTVPFYALDQLEL